MELAISRGSDDVVTAWLDDELDAATAPRLAQLLSLVVLRVRG